MLIFLFYLSHFRSCGSDHAKVLSVWRHSQHSVTNGVHWRRSVLSDSWINGPSSRNRMIGQQNHISLCNCADFEKRAGCDKVPMFCQNGNMCFSSAHPCEQCSPRGHQSHREGLPAVQERRDRGQGKYQASIIVHITEVIGQTYLELQRNIYSQ